MPGSVRNWLRTTFNTLRLTAFFDGAEDPWKSMRMNVAPNSFGMASVHDFSSYLEGDSAVNVDSVEDICQWLRGCQAVDDQTLFLKADHWQHPTAFEQLRRGDCEDHALWAWRKLHGLGLPAIFVAGTWGRVAHAWTLFESGGTSYLLEATEKRGPMFAPLDSLRSRYCPALGVDGTLQTYVYQGYPRFRALAPGPH